MFVLFSFFRLRMKSWAWDDTQTPDKRSCQIKAEVGRHLRTPATPIPDQLCTPTEHALAGSSGSHTAPTALWSRSVRNESSTHKLDANVVE
jgi:hypothetical protein